VPALFHRFQLPNLANLFAGKKMNELANGNWVAKLEACFCVPEYPIFSREQHKKSGTPE
jgi:hypothetical protein